MKYLWFSTKQHAHDVQFKANRINNLFFDYLQNPDTKITEQEFADIEVEKERIDELLDYFVGANNHPVQLPEDLYDYAMSCVGWAASQRR